MSKIIEIYRLPVIVLGMQWLRLILFTALVLLGLGLGSARADLLSFPVTGRVVKVLPLYLDTNSVVAPSPSLFDRDDYQAYLLQHATNLVSGMRFDVCWKAGHARGVKLTLRLELKGIGAGGMPRQVVLEQTVMQKPFHHWISLTLSGTAYKNFGSLAAWRATLWNGSQLLGEDKSFLWSL